MFNRSSIGLKSAGHGCTLVVAGTSEAPLVCGRAALCGVMTITEASNHDNWDIW